MQKALRYAPAAALAAIVVPDVVLVNGAPELFNPKLAAAIAAVLAVTLSRNPWLPFVAGWRVDQSHWRRCVTKALNPLYRNVY